MSAREKSKPPVTPLKRIWPALAAAAVIVAIFIGFYLTPASKTPQQLADDYITNQFGKLSIQMNATEDSLQIALNRYNQGNYQDALKRFEEISATDTANIDAKKFAGIVYLRLKNYDEALKHFIYLENYPGLYSNPGKFYHALTLLERNEGSDKTDAKKLLEQVVNEGLEENVTAKQWLKKLN